MTRSSTKELFKPFENSESAFCSKRRLYETPGLVESCSPELDLFCDIKEHSKEKTTEIMTETMKQYMIKTRGNYWSVVVRPKINDKTHFKIKGQNLKERRENTFSGSKHEGENEHIKKVLKVVDLFHILEITNWDTLKTKFLNKYCPPARMANKIEEINNFQQEPYESLFRAYKRFNELLMKCPQHYLTDMQEVILFYNGLDVPTRKILTKAKRYEENSNIIKEIRASTDAAIRNQGASIKTLEIQIGQMSKLFHERGIGGLPGSTKPNLRDHVKSISTTKADSSKIRRMGYSPYAISGSQHRSIFSKIVPFPRPLQNYCCDDWREAQDVKILEAYDHTLPKKEKDPGSFTLPCFIHNVCFNKAFVDLRASVSVMPFLSTPTLV
uniref:Retrotransposon gag domain-containing protein n=1 Tax=Tanacetum cinerariifolium TaxID=118510 RepID=A0A6L2KQS9_TANCI|nr:hypothetical protein [Tanacetum cinerariifolium]